MESTHIRLPCETYDQVLDHLWDDRRALLASSLVCHAWLPTTRFHLFRTLVFGSNNEPQFFRYLSLSHNIGPYVRCLAFKYYHSVTGEAWLRENYLVHFPEVRRLRVEKGWIYDVALFLRAFPKRIALHIGDVAVGVNSGFKLLTDAESRLATTSSIEHLTLDAANAHLSDWLIDGPLPLRLRSLDLRWESGFEETHVRKLLGAAAPTLEHLRIAFGTELQQGHYKALTDDEIPPTDHGLQVLAEHENLVSLHLDDIDVDHLGQTRRSLEWVPKALESLRSLLLRRIRLSIKAESPGCLLHPADRESFEGVLKRVDLLDWPRIDHALMTLSAIQSQLQVTVHLRAFDEKQLSGSKSGENLKFSLITTIASRLPMLQSSVDSFFISLDIFENSGAEAQDSSSSRLSSVEEQYSFSGSQKLCTRCL